MTPILVAGLALPDHHRAAGHPGPPARGRRRRRDDGGRCDRDPRTCTSRSASSRCSRASTSSVDAGRGGLRHRPVGLGQVDAAALHQPARGADRRARCCVGGDEVTDPDVDIDAVRRRIGMVFQQFNLFPHLTVTENVHDRPAARAAAAARPRPSGSPRDEPRARRAVRQGRRLPGAALGRPAAAGRDRAGAGDGPGADAVRRADLRARPRARRRRAGGHARARRGRA